MAWGHFFQFLVASLLLRSLTVLTLKVCPERLIHTLFPALPKVGRPRPRRPLGQQQLHQPEHRQRQLPARSPQREHRLQGEDGGQGGAHGHA